MSRLYRNLFKKKRMHVVKVSRWHCFRYLLAATVKLDNSLNSYNEFQQGVLESLGLIKKISEQSPKKLQAAIYFHYALFLVVRNKVFMCVKGHLLTISDYNASGINPLCFCCCFRSHFLCFHIIMQETSCSISKDFYIHFCFTLECCNKWIQSNMYTF